ncbi:MAG: metalloregulator ArsR/SmtB family transcription factor [Candidatus Dormibacteraeota bacterium]|nr:metalloregulator ArsR/SmtB family transcription factor [Candidatus Dormibacteraeota bacterium]
MAIEQSQPQLVAMFKALADESRLRIIGLLATRERSVEELASSLRLKPPTVSHHLSTLREMRLVTMRSEGTTHVYRFEPETLRELNRSLAPEKLAIPDDAGGGEWERKVLGDFLENGRLRSIPAAERKRLVVLRWLAGKFEPDRRYSELEVNAIVAEFHNDYASIRRYLVDHDFMARAAGFYWRVDRTG